MNINIYITLRTNLIITRLTKLALVLWLVNNDMISLGIKDILTT